MREPGSIPRIKVITPAESVKTRNSKQRITNVGAGLLAKAVCHSALMLADTPPSRASPLPH
ncbi:hypothetical protein FHG55_10035 [Pseudomonas jessenii]|uniref:Uncharacterized protein n=2 Tax=Pseudomonas TaxID=286 RepID=A0A5C4L0G7_PSEJE|nr:hypothetical protein C1895_05080 [Pseudomonas sp. FW305-3-2-15-E-TSA4]QBX43021.1 hypothetical protein E4T63_21535 [Pseudomonas fluorescens]TNB97409.1 hypothetical protein FHG55_10035 [Pseudomonas jessenii]